VKLLSFGHSDVDKVSQSDLNDLIIPEEARAMNQSISVFAHGAASFAFGVLSRDTLRLRPRP